MTTLYARRDNDRVLYSARPFVGATALSSAEAAELASRLDGGIYIDYDRANRDWWLDPLWAELNRSPCGSESKRSDFENHI